VKNSKKRKIVIFDTTLRDGEQVPGAKLNMKEKIEVARQLGKLRVDVIEAGFPISSPGDMEAVKLIGQQVGKAGGPVIAGLARAVRKDVEACWEAVRHAKRPRIHTFVGTSNLHINMMNKTKPETLKMAVEAVRLAKSLCDDVEFSPMDATRTDFDFLCQVVEAVLKAGATTINVPDTMGYSIPYEFGQLIKRLFEEVPLLRKAVCSVHCHNDLGMATANSLAAVRNGANQIECTINGLGERAGNCSLEEAVMAIKTRRDFFGDCAIGVETKEIYNASRLVSRLTGMMVQANKAVVGANAFSHASGIHQDGVLKNRLNFEIMTPESIGLAGNRLVLTSRSGRHALAFRLKQLGFTVGEKQLPAVYEKFLLLADKKKEVFDEDLMTLVEDPSAQVKETYHLVYLNTTSGSQTIPTATVKISKDGRILQEAACGDGPVDAAYKAIDRLTGVSGELTDYALKAVTGGKDAQGEVTVRLKAKGLEVMGRGSSTDIIEASAKAYLNAVNKIVARRAGRAAAALSP